MERVVAQGRIKKRFDRWDPDGSGELTRSDFEREADEIAATFGRAPEARATARLREALAGLFELCAHQAELPPAGPITEAQFRKVAEDFIFERGEAAFNRALRPVVAGIVEVCDGDGDGRIGRSEFIRWLTVLGLDERGAATAFERVDADGRGALSEHELLAAIRDYHYGRLDAELIAG
ncbi:EF-hand domain-containing protein [Saccharopolyspora griseoalba]|uniref:EF-hand domain-containing protein n=1 Tax=Saccharopolyspora griseoalba TaxID=1431848 RepID=A0ABW2LMU6_9PSEU